MCCFQSWFSQGICPVVESLGHVVVLFLVFIGFFKLFNLWFKKPKLAMGLAIPFACAVGAFTNTVIVLSMIWVFQVLEGMDVLYVIFVTNAIPELIVPSLIVPGIVFGVRSGLRIKDKYNAVLLDPEKREEDETQQKTEADA